MRITGRGMSSPRRCPNGVSTRSGLSVTPLSKDIFPVTKATIEETCCAVKKRTPKNPTARKFSSHLRPEGYSGHSPYQYWCLTAFLFLPKIGLTKCFISRDFL